MSNYAVIVAGGKGKRLGSERNKVFLKLAGREIIVHTIEAFAGHKNISGIVCVVADEDEVMELKELLLKNKLEGRVGSIVPTGGSQRQDGVWVGIEQLIKYNIKDNDLVLIHNGANPFVNENEITRSIEAAASSGASVCAQPVKDTIKKVSENGIAVETLKRSELWRMQTPQTIKYSLAVKAFKKAFEDKFYGTDDVQLVERIGGTVKIVKCSERNFKITTPHDMLMAEMIIMNPKIPNNCN